MSGSLDTNIVLRLLVNDIEHQYKLAKELVENASIPLVVSDFVFVEIEYALSSHYMLTRSQIARILSEFTSHPKISCNRRLFSSVLAEYVSTPALSFTDLCLSFYVDQNNQKPLWTFDKKLAIQSGFAKLLA